MEISEIFDKVEKRLNDGTGRALNNNICAYRIKTPNDPFGHRCAVGIFLPDNKEILSYAGGVSWLVDKFKDHQDFPSFIGENLNLMRSLQSLHDNPKNWDRKVFNEEGQRLFKKLKEEYLGKAE